MTRGFPRGYDYRRGFWYGFFAWIGGVLATMGFGLVGPNALLAPFVAIPHYLFTHVLIDGGDALFPSILAVPITLLPFVVTAFAGYRVAAQSFPRERVFDGVTIVSGYCLWAALTVGFVLGVGSSMGGTLELAQYVWGRRFPIAVGTLLFVPGIVVPAALGAVGAGVRVVMERHGGA
jgi:hypothetical protein